MLTIYPACFFKEQGSGSYSVIFPDLDDLATCGKDINEATAMAIDCLAGYIHWLKVDGDPIPDPSPINKVDLAKVTEDIYQESTPAEAFVNVISVDVDTYAKEHFNKSVRKTLTIPEWLNNEALSLGLNFSQVLQEALLAKVQTH